MSTVKIVILAALGLLVLSGTAYAISEGLHSHSDSRAIITNRVGRIVIDADAGDVDVRAGLTRDVMVTRHDSWLLRRPSVRETIEAGTLRIRARCGSLRAILRCRTDLQVDAPPDIDVVVRTNAGDVDLRGLSGRADVQTASGDIRAHRLAPVVMRAATDAGNVSLDLFGEPTRTEVHTGAGNILVVVPYGAYRVDAQAPSGSVRLQGIIRDDLAPQAIDATTDAGDIAVRSR